MRKLSRKFKSIITLVTLLFIVFYIEILSYIVNTKYWTPFPSPLLNLQKIHTATEDENGPLRVLLVADPQIQGENNELPFFGLFTRWDADRYLQRNFMLAKYHVQPHLVIFLGDLFDEGSLATDPEYRRYYGRFKEIFQLPRKQDPQLIDYIFLPGDNDVGGEGAEPVNPVKLKWFNQTFGDFKKELWMKRHSLNVQFLKMNLFLPEEYQDPIKGREYLLEHSGTQSHPEFRILLSHTSLLRFRTNTVQTILDRLHPEIIFAAHSHESSYFQVDGEQPQDPQRITHKFLMAHKHPSQQWNVNLKLPFWKKTDDDIDYNFNSLDEESLLLQKSSTITLNLNSRDTQRSKMLHEINVPTCSYRMGVPHMGFGAFNLYKNGTLEYTVLWLPSRLNQLYTYMALYFLMKITVISWLFVKLFRYIITKAKQLADFAQFKKHYRPLKSHSSKV